MWCHQWRQRGGWCATTCFTRVPLSFPHLYSCVCVCVCVSVCLCACVCMCHCCYTLYTIRYTLSLQYTLLLPITTHYYPLLPPAAAAAGMEPCQGRESLRCHRRCYGAAGAPTWICQGRGTVVRIRVGYRQDMHVMYGHIHMHHVIP